MTLRKLKQEAAKYGAKVSVEIEGHMRVCRVEAPKGHHWNDGYVHEMVDGAYRPWSPDYKDLLSRMTHGIEPCNDSCEWWEDEQ